MRILRFRPPGATAWRLGVLVGEAGDGPDGRELEVADITGALPGAADPLDVARRLGRPGGADEVRRALAAAPRAPVEAGWLGPPVPRPGKFLAIGFNYRAHAAEAGAAPAGFPLFFNKQATCVSGPRDPIPRPAGCTKLDYEGELALVVGRWCRNVPPERAAEVIGGWLACNDVSARDWQGQSPTVTLGKSHDGFGPTGPWLVTPDEIADPQDLSVRTTVNGEERQRGSTADMITAVAEQIAVLSHRCTLAPGDLLSTGSPAGSGQGRTPPTWLAPGDVVRVEVEGVGVLENRVVAADGSPYVEACGPEACDPEASGVEASCVEARGAASTGR